MLCLWHRDTIRILKGDNGPEPFMFIVDKCFVYQNCTVQKCSQNQYLEQVALSVLIVHSW